MCQALVDFYRFISSFSMKISIPFYSKIVEVAVEDTCMWRPIQILPCQEYASNDLLDKII